MKIKFLLSIIYILFIFNSNLLSSENNKTIKVGLLAPLSGPFNEIGNSLLYSLQLALEEINDKNVILKFTVNIPATMKIIVARKFITLKEPNPIREHVISFTSRLPKEFNLHEYIDFDEQFDKSFLEPLSLLAA